MIDPSEGHLGSAITPNPERHSWLRRLAPSFYKGYAAVHWQMTLDQRRRGWLSPEFHQGFREMLLHTMARYRLICPIYCLMPDHLHLIWMGIAYTSDQRLASPFFRGQMNRLLAKCRTGAFRLQGQAYDHVLRQDDRRVEPVRELAHYILENPRRARLIQADEVWPYLGCMIPGYPDLHPLDGDYWSKFWRIRSRLRGEGTPEEEQK
jgi:putative transposase